MAEVFNRKEIKYIISKEQYERMKDLMKIHMEEDKFAKYKINNVYFDTPSMLLIRRSIEHPKYKEKLRVRTYDQDNDDDRAFIELKKKYNGIVYKRRVELTKKNAMEYMEGNIEPKAHSQILNEIDYFLKFYSELTPAVKVTYDREAFHGIENDTLRITFDKNIIVQGLQVEMDQKAHLLLKDEMVLLEVKTVDGLPFWLVNFMSSEKIYKTSFSKYGSAYIRYFSEVK